MWRWSKGFITYNLRDPEKKREERERERDKKKDFARFSGRAKTQKK